MKHVNLIYVWDLINLGKSMFAKSILNKIYFCISEILTRVICLMTMERILSHGFRKDRQKLV